ncbi:MAG: beta-galactosidase [Defluviitaleaceae bacterium]|nr:beta-galactosidase [Defluviitaleaceae bacterium]
MQKIKLTEQSAERNAKFISREGDALVFRMPKENGGINIPELVGCKERYFTFFAESKTEHSVCMKLCFYTDNSDKYSFYINFGLLPNIRALVCMDMEWVKGDKVFPERNPGQVKLVCLGEHIHRDHITKVTIENSDCFTEIDFAISDLKLTDEYPTEFPIPDVKLIDKYGQYKLKDWPNKIKNDDMLRECLTNIAGVQGEKPVFPFSHWNERYGSAKDLKLTDGTGFFDKIKNDGRWWLVDPQGYAFFSVGVDVIIPQIGCRVDGVEKWLDWLPSEDDPVYGKLFEHVKSAHSEQVHTFFPYELANMHKVFGDNWYEIWQDFMPRFLKNSGLNTVGNWSDYSLSDKTGMPYVDWLREFPTTETLIFRDFPDVYSPEYRENAKRCAKLLEGNKNDPNLIGYFLRNEPHWAFADKVNLADEVLCCGINTHCKDKLIEFLKEKYTTIDAFNKAWALDLNNFDELNHCFDGGARKPSGLTPASNEDMRTFYKILLNEYIAVPSEECRKVDPNHMNLGMRWAWINDPDIVSGWQHFDVFSINCYQADAVPMMDYAVNAGVDLPIMIGEFQFGALDAGPTASGLFSVMTQTGRARAYRHYVERHAAHPNGVGVHYFQCYDQFTLGRADGENYNIGFLDLCSQPYETFINDGVLKTSEIIYEIMEGKTPPYSGEKADYIPMIAY